MAQAIGIFRCLDGGTSWASIYSTTQLDPLFLGVFAKEWGTSSIDAIFDFWYVRKCIASEPSQGSWGNEESFSSIGQESIQNTGNHLSVSGIPTGVGWHGPTFTQTLPSYIRLADFGCFSANMSLLHGGQNQRMGQTFLCLYDDAYSPVLLLAMVDASGTSNGVQVTATFFDTSMNAHPSNWPIVYGDYNGIVSIRLDPISGLFAKMSGQSQQSLMTLKNLVSYLSRAIKYVGIHCDRYGTNDEHDERIYSIRVSYCTSQYTSIHDACFTNSSYHQDDSFGSVHVKEDAEDGDTALWYVYDGTGNITNIAEHGGRAIRLQGNGMNTGYKYPDTSAHEWNDTSDFVIQWSMRYSEFFQVYISVDTSAGHRYLYYEPVNSNNLGPGEYVHHGIGSTTTDGNWHTFTRDLSADLHEAQPSTNIVKVKSFLIRGSGCIDDIKLLSYCYVKEDAEDGLTNGWGVCTSYGGTISNVLVDGRRAIHLQGQGTATGYQYPYGVDWNDQAHLKIQWSMKYSENFAVYVSIDTSAGHRYMCYVPSNQSSLGAGEYVYHGIGSNAADGTWRTFTRDLLTDLHDAQPTADIIDVNCFIIYGSGYVDDINLLTRTSIAGLVVPSGASYLTTNVEPRAADSFWHGPTFVQPLNRPFRLYQLAGFTVRFEAVQASNRMGEMYVNLLDQDMKCVISMCIGDAWSGSTQGYVYTEYFPENGGGYYQEPAYLTTSFVKTASVWYDRCSNSIRSAIDGSIVTLAAAYNASRIISYIVIRSSRYADIPLLDMRVHDIDVAVNLRATLPWVPEPPKNEEPPATLCDGTSVGVPNAVFGVDNAVSDAGATTTLWWTGWWPLLHIKAFSQLASGASYDVELTIDLLGNLGLVGLDLYHPSIQALGDDDVHAMALYAIAGMQELPAQLVLLQRTIEVVFFAIDLLASPGVVLPPPLYQVLLGLLGGVSVLMTVWLYAIWLLVSSGAVSAGAAISALLEMAIFTLGLFVYGNVLGSIKFFGEFWWMKGLKNYGTWVKWGLAFHILNAVVKIVFLVAIIILIFGFIPLLVPQYLSSARGSEET